jgi:hypothetical protein
MKLNLIIVMLLYLLGTSQLVVAQPGVSFPLPVPDRANKPTENIEPEPTPEQIEIPVVRELGLQQISFPPDLFLDGEKGEQGSIILRNMPFNKELDTYTARVDFRVDGVRSDIDMDIYLAFSTRPLFRSEYKTGVALDLASLEIVAGLTVPAHHTKHFLNPGTSFSLGGFSYTLPTSVVIAVDLADILSAPQLYSDEIYFQVIALPSGSLDFENQEVQSSEVNFYRIIRN